MESVETGQRSNDRLVEASWREVWCRIVCVCVGGMSGQLIEVIIRPWLGFEWRKSDKSADRTDRLAMR